MCVAPRPYPHEAATRRKFLFCRCSAPRHRVKLCIPLLSSACPLLTGHRRAVPPRHQPGNLPPRACPPPPRVREPSRQAGALLRGILSGFFLLPGRLHANRLHRPPFGPADHATSFASSPCGSPTTPTPTPTPTSATPPTPHRRFSPLNVRRCGKSSPSLLPQIGPPRRRCPPWPLPPLPSTSGSPDFSLRPDGSRHDIRSQARPCPRW
jgi:hypothetical protein